MAATAHLGEVLRTNAHVYPERTGARNLTRAMTFRQWNVRACRLANALLGLGLRKGDRVAVFAYNCVEWMEIYAATAKAGLVAVPVNFRLVGNESAVSSDARKGLGCVPDYQALTAWDEAEQKRHRPRES